MSNKQNQVTQILKLLQVNCVHNNEAVNIQHYVDLIESVYVEPVVKLSDKTLKEAIQEIVDMDEYSKDLQTDKFQTIVLSLSKHRNPKIGLDNEGLIIK